MLPLFPAVLVVIVPRLPQIPVDRGCSFQQSGAIRMPRLAAYLADPCNAVCLVCRCFSATAPGLSVYDCNLSKRCERTLMLLSCAGCSPLSCILRSVSCYCNTPPFDDRDLHFVSSHDHGHSQRETLRARTRALFRTAPRIIVTVMKLRRNLCFQLVVSGSKQFFRVSQASLGDSARSTTEITMERAGSPGEASKALKNYFRS